MCPSTNGAIAAPKATNPADARVHAIGDEQPGEARSAVLRNPGVADFMARVSSRLRNTQAPCLRIQTRREFFDLLRGLDLDVSGEPPYNLEAAEKVRDFLVTAGLGQDLLLDFTTFLQGIKVEAQKRREQAQKIAKEAAEALEEKRRRKGEWDVIEKSDVEDLEEPWEMVSEAETGSDGSVRIPVNSWHMQEPWEMSHKFVGLGSGFRVYAKDICERHPRKASA